LVEIGAARLFAAVAGRRDGAVVRAIGEPSSDRVRAVDRQRVQLAAHQRRERVAEMDGRARQVELRRELLPLLLGDARETASQRLVVERRERDVEALDVLL